MAGNKYLALRSNERMAGKKRKMQDQMSGGENAGPKNAGPKNQDRKIEDQRSERVFCRRNMRDCVVETRS